SRGAFTLADHVVPALAAPAETPRGLLAGLTRLAKAVPITARSTRMNEALSAETISVAGHGGDEIEAYLAVPVGSRQFGSVVVIPHRPGYDSATKEITRKFAACGYAALMPNLYHREAPGASPDDAAAIARASGGVPDERLAGDVGGAAGHLRCLPGSNGKVGVIGYCSGGRQSFLSACSLQLDAAVDGYGAFLIHYPLEGVPR